MRAQEVVEVDKGCKQAIGTVKRAEPSARFIPSFKLVVKRFDEVVGNDIVKVFNSDMFSAREEQLDGLRIGKIPIRDNCRPWCAKLISAALNQAKSTVKVAIRRKIKVENKTCFRINGQPQIVVFAIDFDIGFIEVPLVRVRQINLFHEAVLQVLKDRCETLDPLGNGDMRNMNLVDR